MSNETIIDISRFDWQDRSSDEYQNMRECNEFIFDILAEIYQKVSERKPKKYIDDTDMFDITIEGQIFLDINRTYHTIMTNTDLEMFLRCTYNFFDEIVKTKTDDDINYFKDRTIIFLWKYHRYVKIITDKRLKSMGEYGQPVKAKDRLKRDLEIISNFIDFHDDNIPFFIDEVRGKIISKDMYENSLKYIKMMRNELELLRSDDTEKIKSHKFKTIDYPSKYYADQTKPKIGEFIDLKKIFGDDCLKKSTEIRIMFNDKNGLRTIQENITNRAQNIKLYHLGRLKNVKFTK